MGQEPGELQVVSIRQSTIDIANRANVAIYIIDSSGLTGGIPQSGGIVPASPLAAIRGIMPRFVVIRVVRWFRVRGKGLSNIVGSSS